MPEFEISEIITLSVALLLSPLVITSARDFSTSVRHGMLAAYVCILVAQIATNLEGLAFPVALNLVEHAATGLTGVFFALTVMAIARRRAQEDTP